MSVSAVGSEWNVAANQAYASSAAGAPALEKTGAGAATGDSAMLSPQGTLLSSLFDTQPGAPITGADIQAFADKKLKEFAAGFAALLKANGIDPATPVTLGHEPGTGRVIVTNDSPDADKINRLLANNLDLCNTYTAGTSALETLKQLEEHTQFAQAYAQDPQGAVARFRYLFTTQWNADVTFAGDQFDVAYHRSSRGR